MQVSGSPVVCTVQQHHDGEPYSQAWQQGRAAYLATEIPDLKFNILVVDFFHVAANSWLCDDHLAQMTVNSAAH